MPASFSQAAVQHMPIGCTSHTITQMQVAGASFARKAGQRKTLPSAARTVRRENSAQKDWATRETRTAVRSATQAIIPIPLTALPPSATRARQAGLKTRQGLAATCAARARATRLHPETVRRNAQTVPAACLPSGLGRVIVRPAAQGNARSRTTRRW